MTWVYYLSSKSDTKQCIEIWLQSEVIAYGHLIKRFRTDRGTEFVNTDLLAPIDNLNIKEEYSMAYYQAQNGVVERRHRFILGLIIRHTVFFFDV